MPRGTDSLEDLGDVEHGSDLYMRRRTARRFKEWCEGGGGDVGFDSGGMPDHMQCDVEIGGVPHEVSLTYGDHAGAPKINVQGQARDANGRVSFSAPIEQLHFNGFRLHVEQPSGHAVDIHH